MSTSGTNLSEDIRNEVAKAKRLLGLDVNRLALGSEVEGVVPGGVFGPVDYTITGVNVIEFVEVSSTLGPSQGGTPPPPQVTGLTTNVISNTQINLSWTAYGGSDLDFYTVYRGTSPGFSADSSSDIAFPTTNSYNNTGLTAGTAYYYRVATTNDAGLEGPLSSEVSGTTTGGGDVTPPGQVTGLTATVISDTQINLAWTASGAGDLNHYDVHRSTTTGFTPAVGNRISQPTTNSLNNTGLTASTTYYYKVAAVDNSSNIGTYSTQASGTTTSGGPAISPSLLLHFDGNLTDSSTFGNTVTSFNSSGFVGSGQFGTNSVKLNDPTVATDHVEVTHNTNIAIDMADQWSFSCWIYSKNANGDIFSKFQSSTNYTTCSLYFGDLRFRVTKAGTSYGRMSGSSGSTLPLNVWNHVAGTWDGTTNTMTLYLNKVLQNTSVVQTISCDNLNLWISMHNSGASTFSPFVGRIDEFQLFKGLILTQTQVNNLFSTNVP